jgi:hypothetical protein
MGGAKATATLREAADGDVFIQVETHAPLTDVWGVPLAPEEYELHINGAHNPGNVELMCSQLAEPGVWLPLLRVQASGALVDRYIDISAGSEERRLLKRMIQREYFDIVWINESVRARKPVQDELRKASEETFARFPDLDRAAWTEFCAELDWLGSPNWRPGPRPTPPKRRTAQPPPGATLRYFAARSGALPRDGVSRVVGIPLPRGRRIVSCWASDEPVDEAVELAAELAQRFSQTGLWPLLWPCTEEPESSLGGFGDLDAIDTIDPEAVLRRAWDSIPWQPEWLAPLGPSFPGLAPGVARDPSRPFAPFKVFEAQRLRFGGSNAGGSSAMRLLLAPCNRPADAVAAAGFETVGLRGEEISAILRSWEERFGAVPTSLEPDFTSLSVEAAPASFSAALGLTAEHFAVRHGGEDGRAGALARQARLFEGASVWDLVWRS